MVTDYYAMLGVDPSANGATIEEALARNQPVWSSGTRNPKTKHTYQSYLDQIPAIRQALLADSSSRAAYNAEVAAARRADRELRLDALQKRIRLRAAKGGLTVSDRKLLREEATRLGLDGSDLDSLIEPIPPMPECPDAVPKEVEDAFAEVLDPVMRRQIRVALDHLRKHHLYEALGLSRDAPMREISARADTERQRWMKKTQVTAEKTAWLEVVTLAQSHLTNETARTRYDRTLILEDEESFIEAAAFALKGLPHLDPGTRATLLDEAAALGVLPERAECLLSRICGTMGIARDSGAFRSNPNSAPVFSNGPTRHLRCRSCTGLTEFGVVAETSRPNCRHCDALLQWTCPVCRRSRWVDEPRCVCGFRVEFLDPLIKHFEAAQQAYRNRDYALALGHLKRVQEYAPKHAGARKGMERVKEKVAAMDKSRAAFEIARAGGRLVEAKAAAESWGKLVDPGMQDWRTAYTEVTRQLRDAHDLAARARRRERIDPAAARDLYRKCLAIAADLSDAREGLKRCPPDPPSELSAEFVDDHVKLRWSPPPPDELGPVSYVILRKGETAFTHTGDGFRIGEASLPEFDDSGVIPGTSVSYAIVTKRGESESVGAVTLGPIFVLGEVRGVQVKLRSREVDLTWTPPRGTSEVRVVRKRGAPPSSPVDGQRLEASNNQAHDQDLESDRVYHYGIFAIYRSADGRATASRGVFVTAQPHTPARPLDPPTIAVDPEGRVTLRWIEPTRGIVKILRTPQPLAHAAGVRLSPMQVASLEGYWLELDGPEQAQDTPVLNGICYYTPLTSWGGAVTVGHAAAHSWVTDPSDLRAGRAGRNVYLKWRWSSHGNQSLVVFKQGSPPTGPDDPAAHRETVYEADYTRLARHALTLPPGDSAPWHVAVYAIVIVNAQPVTSPGSDPSARTVVPGPNPEVTLIYQFRKRRITGRAWTIHMLTEPAGSEIPPTVLVTHPRTVPLSADDGTIIASFPAARDGASFPFPERINPRRINARVFPDPRSEPDRFAPIRLRHPESDTTRV